MGPNVSLSHAYTSDLSAYTFWSSSVLSFWGTSALLTCHVETAPLTWATVQFCFQPPVSSITSDQIKNQSSPPPSGEERIPEINEMRVNSPRRPPEGSKSAAGYEGVGTAVVGLIAGGKDKDGTFVFF